jgi:hypothetical protein
MLRCALWQKLTDVSEAFISSIIATAMDSVSTSETSVNLY